MNKICFYISEILRGGSELALLRLIKLVDKKTFDISVVYKGNSDEGMLNEFKAFSKLYKGKEASHITFDIGINCAIYEDKEDFFKYIKAKKNILWVQIDPLLSKEQYLEKDFNRYDKLMCVSQFIKNEVLKISKDLESKIFVLNPITNSEEVTNKARETQNEIQSDIFNIITVARISNRKGIHHILEIAKYLKEKKLDFKWYIMGFLPETKKDYYESLTATIDKYKLKEEIIFMGERENPYKYVKACDLSVLLSDNEAWGLVITESKILGTPVLSFNNSAVPEQIENMVNGILVDVVTNNEDYKKIADIIYDLKVSDKLTNIKANIKDFNFNGQAIADEFVKECLEINKMRG